MARKCHLFFETLGTRLKVDLLLSLQEEPMNITALSKHLDQERSKVSHALKSLWECGFVEFKKNGRERIYILNSDTILPLLNLVEKHVQKHCKICRKKRGVK